MMHTDDRRRPTPPDLRQMKPDDVPPPPRMDLRSGKPSWDELDAMYTRAIAVVADMRVRLDAAEQRVATARAIAVDAIAAWQGEDDCPDDALKRSRSARTRAELWARLQAVGEVRQS